MSGSVLVCFRVFLILVVAAWPATSHAESFPLAEGQPFVGSIRYYTTKASDTLVDLARALDLGYTELMAANPGVDPWLPGDDTLITIPSLFLLPDTERRGIVVNLARQRLYYFPKDGETVMTFPIGVGVEGRSTPIGTTRIVDKRANPTWYPPESIRADRPELPKAVPPGPDNPLGAYALYLGWPSYVIHGTNRPYGIGRNVSQGCIRLYPEDIEHLFKEVPKRTPVRVIDEEMQLAWIGEDLYLAVFPNKSQAEEIGNGRTITAAPPPGLQEKVMSAAGDKLELVVWPLVDQVAERRSGIPTLVTLPSVIDPPTD